jgi:hypothetical protein
MSTAAPGIADTAQRNTRPVHPFATASEHLLAELARLKLMVQREVLRLRAAHVLIEDQFRGLYVSDEQVDQILRDRYQKSKGSSGQTESPPAMQQLNQGIQEAQSEIASRIHASLMAGVPLPLVHLASLFPLSEFELEVLLVCVAPEIDPLFETLYSYAQNNVTKRRPTPNLILNLLCATQGERLNSRSALSADGTLFRAQLVRYAEDSQDREPALLARPLRVEERIVELLLGQPAMDGYLRPFTMLANSGRQLSSLHLPEALSSGLINALACLGNRGGILFFHGSRGTGKRSTAEGVSTAMGRPLLVADLSQAVTASRPLSTTLSLLYREAMLQRANLFLNRAESLKGDDVEHQRQRIAFLQSLCPTPLLTIVSSEGNWPQAGTSVQPDWLAFEFPAPLFAHRTKLWAEAIASTRCSRLPNDAAAALANKFVLTGGEIHEACSKAKTHALLRTPHDPDISQEDFEAAARAQSNQGLCRLTQKVKTIYDWNDLVLPPRAAQQLREVCASEKYRHIVYSRWGFDQRLALGKGINVLFCGPSGTGKTMSAGIVARELGLDLYKIDLSTVVSKYIGETEKQLSQIFREAQASNAILFFDEADALFGKRSEVKDAHDRYANVEVAYLLQKMEEYEGIVILATNFRKNLDEAFTRRMHHIVDFPFPDAEYRERIWTSMMPRGAPLAEDVNFGFLARQFELAGGNIRNVALAAAFLAAEAGSAICMEHFILATAREFQKMGKLPSQTEFREYYDLTRKQN